MNCPEPPGEHPSQEVSGLIRFTQAKPMDFTLDEATQALRRANDSSKPALAHYPPSKHRRFYVVSGPSLQAGQLS